MLVKTSRVVRNSYSSLSVNHVRTCPPAWVQICSCHSLTAPFHPSRPVYFEQKTATAVAYCKRGRGLIKVNGCPIELLEPAILRVKTFEPVLLLGTARFSNVDIRVRVRGGGYTSQVRKIAFVPSCTS